MKTPDEINMNAENAFVLREAAKAHADGYYDHISHGGKGDPAEERWIEALNAGADALAYIQRLERERDALLIEVEGDCEMCKHNSSCVDEGYCAFCENSGSDKCPCCNCVYSCNWEWCGVKEDDK